MAQLTPEQIAKAKEVNIVNIFKKLKDGKTLTPSERDQLDAASAKNEGDQLPIFDSIAQCASACGIPLATLKQAKRAGCPAFRNSRVYLREFLVWAFSKEEDPDDSGIDWGTELKKAQTKRERIKLKRDAGSVMDIGEAQEVVANAHTRVVAALDRVFLSELPPVLKGLDELGIRGKCKEKIDVIKAELSINEEPITTREQRKVETN